MKTEQLNLVDKAIDWSNKNLLLVEDNEVSIKLIKEYLHRTNIGITVSQCAKDTISLINHSKYYDAILLDIRLPDNNGLELYRIIREKVPEIPVVICTAIQEVSLRRVLYAEEQNIPDILIKPVTKRDVLETLLPYMN